MEELPAVMSPSRPAGSPARAAFRLKLVYSKAHRKALHCDRCKETRTVRKRSRQIEDLLSVFAREVSNPLGGLSASLQFALRDLAQIPLHNSPRKRNLDLLIVEQTLHGALRDVHHLIALLDDFRSRMPLQIPARRKSGNKRTVK